MALDPAFIDALARAPAGLPISPIPLRA
jgi:hypothetical protein